MNATEMKALLGQISPEQLAQIVANSRADEAKRQEILAPLLARAVDAQTAALKPAAAVVDGGNNLFGALVDIVEAAKANKFAPESVKSAIETTLGETKGMPASVASYRSRINVLLPLYLDNASWVRALENTPVSEDGAKLPIDTTLKQVSFLTITKLLRTHRQMNKDAERIEFEGLLSTLVRNVKRASKNTAADKDTGAPAYTAVKLSELTSFLREVIDMVPVRESTEGGAGPAGTVSTEGAIDTSAAVAVDGNIQKAA